MVKAGRLDRSIKLKCITQAVCLHIHQSQLASPNILAVKPEAFTQDTCQVLLNATGMFDAPLGAHVTVLCGSLDQKSTATVLLGEAHWASCRYTCSSCSCNLLGWHTSSAHHQSSAQMTWHTLSAICRCSPMSLLGCFVHHKQKKSSQQHHPHPFRNNVIADDTCIANITVK